MFNASVLTQKTNNMDMCIIANSLDEVIHDFVIVSIPIGNFLVCHPHVGNRQNRTRFPNSEIWLYSPLKCHNYVLKGQKWLIEDSGY